MVRFGFSEILRKKELLINWWNWVSRKPILSWDVVRLMFDNSLNLLRSFVGKAIVLVQASLFHVIVGGAITRTAQYLEELDGGDEYVILRRYRPQSQTESDRFLLYQPTVVEFPDQ
jgi:hypothetical protein